MENVTLNNGIQMPKLGIGTFMLTPDQTEAHPYYPQTEMKKFLQKEDMKIQAWYPLGHGDKGLINEPIFGKLAEKYGKSNVQIILRWHIQSDHIVIPGATNPEHIKANIDIFDFALTEEEMQEITKINKRIQKSNNLNANFYDFRSNNGNINSIFISKTNR